MYTGGTGGALKGVMRHPDDLSNPEGAGGDGGTGTFPSPASTRSWHNSGLFGCESGPSQR